MVSLPSLVSSDGDDEEAQVPTELEIQEMISVTSRRERRKKEFQDVEKELRKIFLEDMDVKEDAN
eukprot:1408448-Karenia_brevis.AAC.1